jgi:hypothetical protein
MNEDIKDNFVFISSPQHKFENKSNSENKNDDIKDANETSNKNNINIRMNSIVNENIQNEERYSKISDSLMKKKRENNSINISKHNSKNSEIAKSNLGKLNEKIKYLVSNGSPKHKTHNNNNNSSFNMISSPKMNNFVEINLKNLNNGSIRDGSSPKNRKNKKNNNRITNITNNELTNKNGTKTGYEDKTNDFNEMNNNFYINCSQYNFPKNKGLNNSVIITKFRLKDSLFSMRDYIYSFFIKAIRHEYKYLSKEFSAIFNFLSEIYDVSSYLQLYKQFHILSGFLLDNVANIDINHKININNKELFEQIASKNKNVFYFALKEQFQNIN